MIPNGNLKTKTCGYQTGFTLIELIVVIALISVLVLFAAPKFDSMLFSDSTRKVQRWIVYNAMHLKNKAVKEKKDFTLHADISGNQFWISDETTDEETAAVARESSEFVLPENVKLVSVIYPDDYRSEPKKDTVIRFYKKGYSDMAIIQIENKDEERFSLIIEPFLNSVIIEDGFVGFDP